jgi:hypothetical protein
VDLIENLTGALIEAGENVGKFIKINYKVSAVNLPGGERIFLIIIFIWKK